MRYVVHVTKKAERDLDDAAEYIRTKLSNPEAAYNLVLRARRVFNDLTVFPESNRIVDEPILSSWGIRFTMVKNYFAFYIISGETVHIVRFLHSRRDWAYILRQGIELD